MAGIVHGHKVQNLRHNTILLATQDGVAHTMAALIGIKRRARRLPARIPHRVAVLDVEVAPIVVGRHVVIAVAGNAAQLGILVKAITTTRVGDKREKSVGAQVVNPRQRSLRRGNHVLAALVVKMAKLGACHNGSFQKDLFKTHPSCRHSATGGALAHSVTTTGAQKQEWTRAARPQRWSGHPRRPCRRACPSRCPQAGKPRAPRCPQSR